MKYNPDDYFKEVAENVDIYNINELGPTTGTVFQVFASNNSEVKINTLFDTGAMKSVMSWKMYEKLKLNDLDTTSIPHVVGASGESLGARGRTKCKININGKKFYQTFIVCEHLKRPIILGRDFSIQNCIGISCVTAESSPSCGQPLDTSFWFKCQKLRCHDFSALAD